MVEKERGRERGEVAVQKTSLFELITITMKQHL